MDKPIPVIYDGDPGHDDAIALMLAGASRKLQLLAVTTCCGNQTMEKTSYNALRVCTLLGLRVPVAKGRTRPLFSPPMTAANIHGVSGLDGPPLPEPAFALSPLSSVALMAQTLSQSDEPVVIVSTGPMTNTGALLLMHPELKEKIRAIYFMGGGLAYGNWTPAAEFNILVDPEAAETVFSSGIPLTMAGLDVTEKALLYPEDFAFIRAQGGAVAQTVADWLEYFFASHQKMGYSGAPLHDPCAVAALIAPELFSMKDYYVQVETEGAFTRGTTVADVHGTLGQAPNVRCLLDVDRKGFVRLLANAVKYYDTKESQELS